MHYTRHPKPYTLDPKQSFILIELIVVIAIIAVLAAVISTSVFKAIEKAKISKAISDYKTIKSATHTMLLDINTKPWTALVMLLLPAAT